MWKRLVTPLIFLLLFASIMVSVALILGEEKERKVWAETPSTLPLYTSEEVCLDDSTGNVLNCGHCGACSNLHDIRLYHEQRLTLTGTMEECARGDLLFGNDVYVCLKEKAGMTDGCTKCWVLNYECNIQHCVRTCVKQRFFKFLPSLGDWNSDPADPCFACDEKLCGPVFVECAGANRRRVGVVSDIQRNTDKEICGKVDWDWILSDGREPVYSTTNLMGEEL